MKKCIIVVLLGLTVILLSSCMRGNQANSDERNLPVASISYDSDGIVFDRYFTLEEFKSLKEGESTIQDILALRLADGLFSVQYSYGEMIMYPLDDYKYLTIFVDRDGLVTEIKVDETTEQSIKVTGQ